MREFVAEHFLLPEKNTIKSFITESELLAHDFLNSTLEKSWTRFRQEAQPVDGKRFFYNTFFFFLESVRVLSRWYSDTPVGATLPPFILGYVKSLEELLALGELIPRTAIINLLRAFLKFVHAVGIERHFPVSSGTWSDTEKGEFGRLHVDERAMGEAAAVGNGFYFNKWQDVELIEEAPRLEAHAYLKKGAYIMDVSNDCSRAVLYAYTSLLADTVKVKAREVADNQISEVLISAMRRVISVAKKGAAEAARAKQQEKAEKGGRATKRKSDLELEWVAAAAQILLNAKPFMSESEIATALSSREERANWVIWLDDPAQKAFLSKPPSRLGKYRTIRKKLKEARALGLIVSPQRTDLQSPEGSAP